MEKKKTNIQRIGKLKKIIIYPLAGGIPFEVKEADCSESGLVYENLVDRSYVAYSPKTRTAILNLHNSNLGTQNIDKLLNIIRNPTVQCQQKKLQIYYLGTRVEVEDLGDEIAMVAQNTFGYSLGDIRIAYCSPENRIKLVTDGVKETNDAFTEEVDNQSPFYSHYTLLNSKSLEYLQEQTGKNIVPPVFRANLVFDGKLPKFGEDEISFLYIGKNVQFNKFKPCTHTPGAFATPESGPNPVNQEPYHFLKRTRTSSDDLKNPAFGMNMSLRLSGHLKLGDILSAFLFDPS